MGQQLSRAPERYDLRKRGGRRPFFNFSVSTLRGGSESREVPSVAPWLHVSNDGRYLVDSNDQPFFLVGDTAWSSVP